MHGTQIYPKLKENYMDKIQRTQINQLKDQFCLDLWLGETVGKQ